MSCCKRTWENEFIYTGLGILMNAWVVTNTFKDVAKLRHKFSIKPPSITAKESMTDDDKSLWNRQWRTQQNCVEWFALTTPLFIVGSITTFKAFGSNSSRIIGGLSIANAIARNAYAKAYPNDASKRGKPFTATKYIIYVAFGMTVVSTLYLIGKDIKSLYESKIKK